MWIFMLLLEDQGVSIALSDVGEKALLFFGEGKKPFHKSS